MLRSLLRVVGLDIGTPVVRPRKMSETEYGAVREILKTLASEGKYFAYCPDDGTLIWHQGLRGAWQRDDDGSQFLRFATTKASAREAALALWYFKASCYTSHIDATLKAKRLAGRKETK